jgi:transposase
MTMPSEVESAGDEAKGVRPGYRRHSREFKERIIAEYYSLPDTGGLKGSFLRREKLARHQISQWRQSFADEAAGMPARRAKRTGEQVEVEQLRKANARLQAELNRTRLALEITGKAHALLELFSESVATESRPPR